jgi:hypothetical protein
MGLFSFRKMDVSAPSTGLSTHGETAGMVLGASVSGHRLENIYTFFPQVWRDRKCFATTARRKAKAPGVSTEG